MPGLSLQYGPSGGADAEPGILKALDGALCEGWRVEVLRRAPGLAVACTRYDGYPVLCFEEGGIWGCLEGRLYGKAGPGLRAELAATARAMLAPEVPAEALHEWVAGADGEFLLVAHDAGTGAVAILNDSLGQLPLVYRDGGGRLVASRHLGVVARLDGAPRFDRMGLAQYLLFRYTLGGRTLVEGVRLLPPGSLLRAGVGGCGVECRRLHVHDFSRAGGNGLDGEGNAREVARLLRAASARRADSDGRNVVLLSGGLDSRMVSAALLASGARAGAATYEEPGKADARYAARVAAALGLEWRLFDDVYPARGRDALDLLRAKDGAVGVRAAFHMPFVRRVAEAWGPAAMAFTGEGGDKVLPDVRPARRVASAEEFLAHVFGRNAVLPLREAAELAGVAEGDIRDEVLRVAAAFPEADWAARYVHFLVHGRLLAWSGQLFDAYRAFLCATSPFLASDVFRHAMGVPWAHKARERLRCRVLELVSPELAGIPEANYGLRPGAFLRGAALRATEALRRHPWLWRRVRRVLMPRFHRRAYGPDAGLVRCLRDQAASGGTVAAWLASAAIERIAASAPARHIWELESLFSVASAVEWLATGRSRLDAYRDDAIII